MTLVEVARGPVAIAAVVAVRLADLLTPPEPVTGWTPNRFDYDEQD